MKYLQYENKRHVRFKLHVAGFGDGFVLKGLLKTHNQYNVNMIIVKIMGFIIFLWKMYALK
jgi:hypothetical protein